MSAGGQAGATRRAVLRGAGVVCAAGFLAACGGEAAPAPSPPGGGGPTSSGPTTPTSPAAPPAIAVSDIPVGGGRVFTDRGVVVTQPAAGEFRAFSHVCPHQGNWVNQVSDGVITCPAHLSQFRITDGSVVRGPNTGEILNTGLTPKTVTVSGDELTIS